MTLADRIRKARRNAGLSQAVLASLIGVQRSSISNWESVSRVSPSMLNLIAAAQATRVNVEWLAAGRGPMERHDDLLLDVPAVDLDWVESTQERELLRLFRALSQRSKSLALDLFVELLGKKASSKKAAI